MSKIEITQELLDDIANRMYSNSTRYESINRIVTNMSFICKIIRYPSGNIDLKKSKISKYKIKKLFKELYDVINNAYAKYIIYNQHKHIIHNQYKNPHIFSLNTYSYYYKNYRNRRCALYELFKSIMNIANADSKFLDKLLDIKNAFKNNYNFYTYERINEAGENETHLAGHWIGV